MFWLILGLLVLYVLGLIAPRMYDTFSDIVEYNSILYLAMTILWPITVLIMSFVYLFMVIMYKLHWMRD